MKYHQYRYFAKDESGRDLFFIELDNSDGLDEMYFISSLGIDLQTMPEIEGLIGSFRKSSNTDAIRNELAARLITAILLLPNIECHFFPDYLLSVAGSYMEFADHVVTDIVQHSDFSDYTPFSEEHHPLVFGKLRLLLSDWYKQGRGEKVDEPSFLSLLPMNEELQHLFVSSYSDCMEFVQFHFLDDNHDQWAIYGLFSCSTLIFSFSIHIE